MANERQIEDYDRILVVEGYSDLLFFAEILEDLDAHETVFIKELGGKSWTRAKLEALISPGLLNSKSAIAFVFDADTEPETTRNSLQDLLSRITGQHIVDGRWSGRTPNVGLFVVPEEINLAKLKHWFGIHGQTTRRTWPKNGAWRVTFPACKLLGSLPIVARRV